MIQGRFRVGILRYPPSIPPPSQIWPKSGLIEACLGLVLGWGGILEAHESPDLDIPNGRFYELRPVKEIIVSCRGFGVDIRQVYSASIVIRTIWLFPWIGGPVCGCPSDNGPTICGLHQAPVMLGKSQILTGRCLWGLPGSLAPFSEMDYAWLLSSPKMVGLVNLGPKWLRTVRVAVKELQLSYHNRDTIGFTICIHIIAI